MCPKIGVVALGRPTFDVPFAEETTRRAFEALARLDVEIVGPQELLFDANSVREALPRLKAENVDLLLLLQVTFTDATMTVAIAEAVDAPILLWGFPETRTGGRLRLNSLCGVNLAAHALGKAGRECAYLFAAADDHSIAEQVEALSRDFRSTSPSAGQTPAPPDASAMARAEDVQSHLRGTRIGRIGTHPDGFDTCVFDDEALAGLTGVTVDQIELGQLFGAAAKVPERNVAAIRNRAAKDLGSLDQLEQEPLDKSLRLYAGLKEIAESRGLSGLSVRCWPEMFTEYGCAACGPMAMLNEEKTPCACEADVYGNVTTLILQRLSGQQAIIADLVDMDPETDTGVLWHCGLAPVSMADPETKSKADIHSNRRKPLLNAFPLKPGRVTIARLSQAKGATKLVVGGGEMIRAPLSFSGTAGVIRFDRPVPEVLDTVIGAGLEHHFGFTYGDFRTELVAVAQRLGISVLALT